MNRIELLDYGRFFAALSVVFYHYTFNGISNGKVYSISHYEAVTEFSRYGYLGVEFFFMISGFVIFYSSKNRLPSEFCISRARRILPSYWFAILFTSFFAFLWAGDKMGITLEQVILNFTMLHRLFGYASVDGVYWTLFYEVMFYALVFLIMLFAGERNLGRFFTIWPVIMFAALAIGVNKYPFLGGYFCFFSAGTLFGMIKEKYSIRGFCLVLLMLGLCLQFSTARADGLTISHGVEHSKIIIGCIVFSFFVFFALLCTNVGKGLKLPWSATLGALTYPLYLIHAHFGYILLNRFATEDNKVFVYVAALVTVMAVAYLMNFFIEIKLSNLWKRFFVRTIGSSVGYIEQKIKFKLMPK